jgi:hypothetical protein
MSDNDEIVSQFLAFTGCSDADRAQSYLEMSGGNLETAVGLFMEHQGGGGGGAGGAAGLSAGMDRLDDVVRAPDETRTMRLMDDDSGHHHGGAHHGGGIPYMHIDPMIEEQLQNSAFGTPSSLFASNPRQAVNAAAAAEAENSDAHNGETKEGGGGDMDDGEDDVVARPPRSSVTGLANMFSRPDHLIYEEGGFEGARNMAKDNKRWLLVNLQRDSEFSCHALNRDVWRDELVENLVREGFIFWQQVRF